MIKLAIKIMEINKLRQFQETIMNTKICSKCKEVKPYGEFNKSKKGKGGVESQCKSCRNVYYNKNRDTFLKKAKKNAQVKKEYLKKYKAKYYKENKERLDKINREWYEKNKQQANQSSAKYYKENKEKMLNYRNDYEKKRRKKDPVFKLRKNVSHLVAYYLKRKKYTKKLNTFQIIGLHTKDFHYWLNTEASNGFNYDIHDVHVDHVIPASFANTEEEVLTLNHYSNLQLLSANDNLKKHNSYINKTNLNRVFKHHPNVELLQSILDRNDYVLND